MKIFEANGRITFEESVSVYDELEPGNYALNHSQNIGFFLSREKDFVLPKKVYGDTSETDRWIRSYNGNSAKNLGILLSGIKGTGKTVMAKKFCIDRKRPTILITAPYAGYEFVKFLSNSALKDCNIFIDEFEKVYPDFDSQKQFLTIMDGVYETRLIFILTSNSHDFNELFFNRLERIKYHKSFRNLESSIVDEIMEDMLDNKSLKDEMIELLESLQINSYDLLISIIKECNLFNESPYTCARYLNLKKEDVRYSIYFIPKVGEKQYLTWATVKSFKKGNMNFSLKNPKFSQFKAENVDGYDVEEYLPRVFEFEGSKRVEETEYGFVMVDKNGTMLEFSRYGQYKGYRED